MHLNISSVHVFCTLQDPDSTDFNIITCKTTLDGKHSSLAASVNVAPNMIDFSEVWSKFADLDENAVVFSVVISTLVLYALLLIWARRKDKHDQFRVSVTLWMNNKLWASL